MSLKIHLPVFYVLFFLGCTATVSAQQAGFAPKNYPKGYFAYPVKATVGLSANFGELRPNHWHMGLDCKTEKKQNMPILAAADGYVAKVKIEPYGFGRAIYINHPNGLTTLYAHLNDLYPELEQWLKEQQYAKQSWRVFLDSIPAHLFPVKKGQFIAYSGNTGGSQGPHLHFEIRDTKSDKVLNPMLFGFNIPDNVPPKIFRLAVYDRCQGVFEQSPRMIPVVYKNGVYTIAGGVLNIKTEQVSFAISATDAVTGNPNPNGIYEAVLYDNDQPVTGFQLDSIGYDETRYLNAHIDYRLKTNGGPYVQHLTALPGYKNGVYRNFMADGITHLPDNTPHQIKIVVRDGAGNSSTLQFALRNADTANSRCVYDSLLATRSTLFFPGMVNVFDNKDVFFYTSPKAVYDSMVFKYAQVATADARAYSAVHQLHTALVPMHDTFTVNLRPNRAIPEALRDRMVIRRNYQGGKFDVVKAYWKGEWLAAKFRGFGNFVLLADVQPPNITPVGLKEGANLAKAKGFSLVVSDDSDEWKNFRGLLDGQWLLLSNDKGRTFKHVFDERCGPGPHVLEVRVEDEAGNVTERTYNFTR